MASRDGAVHHHQVKPKEQPARISLTGQRGGRVTINIGRITGSVTVGNKNHVTHYHHGGGRKGQSRTGQCSSDSDSDSESSSSDSESERRSESFFEKQGQGGVMPTKNQFKEMKRKMMELKSQFSGSRVHSLVVNKTAGTYAVDSSGKPVPIQSQRVSSGPNMQAMGSVNQPQRSNNPPVNQQTPDQLTIYEQQTQKFETIMMQLQNKIITERVIHKISPQMGKGWRRVFRHLDFSDDLIDRTFVECGQVQETVHKLLMKWIQDTDTADVKKLVGALVRAEQVHIIYSLQDR